MYLGFMFRFRIRIKVRVSFLGSFRVRLVLGVGVGVVFSFHLGLGVGLGLGFGLGLVPDLNLNVSPLCFQFLANSLVPLVAVFYLQIKILSCNLYINIFSLIDLVKIWRLLSSIN